MAIDVTMGVVIITGAKLNRVKKIVMIIEQVFVLAENSVIIIFGLRRIHIVG